MTTSKARAQQLKHPSTQALQTYLTSLLYLRQEAKRDGLDVVAEIMWDALAAIEVWLGTGNGPIASHDVLDSSLCQSLEFLVKWHALPPSRQRQVAKDLLRYETEMSPKEEAVPRLRPRASRKIAN